MGAIARRPTIAIATIAAATAFLAGLGAWPDRPELPFWFAGFSVAAVLAAKLDAHGSHAGRPSSMPLSCAIAFAALLFLSPGAMTFTATAAVLARGLVEPTRARSSRDALLNTSAAILATQLAGFAHSALGGTTGTPLEWPWQAVPIAAAVLVFSFVWTGSLDLMAQASPTRSWAWSALRSCPMHAIAAGLAVALVELIVHRAWELIPIAAAPAFFALRAYAHSADRVDADRRHRDRLASLEHGVALLDAHGHVTLWNDALARQLDCPPSRALGQSVADAVPSLARTDVVPAIDDALERGRFGVVSNIAFAAARGTRTLRVQILPEGGGAALHCDDETARAEEAQATERTAHCLTLAADGANDGLWEWDMHGGQLYVSPRWRAMLGLPPLADATRPEAWFDRMHPEDRSAFNDALGAHLAGRSERLRAEIRLRHEDSTYHRFLCCGVAEAGAHAWQTRVAGSLTDISDDSIAHDLIRSAEFRDPLTGLANRAVFVKGLGRRLNDFARARGGRFAVLYLDLDRFKVVNDSLGHLVGDELLTAVSRRLESCLRAGDSLARLGGDEFAILLHDLGDVTQANAIAFRIQDTLAAPFAIAGREVVTSASIGIAFCRSEYTNPEEMMRDADTAMYQAKAHGKARHELFDADMHARALDRLGFEDDLRHAVRSHAFELHYQPIVALATGICTGFEALVRWTRYGQRVSPAQFIPVAEELGLIEPLGTWVLQEACRMFAAWKRRFPARALECVTVNVSTRQLIQQGFLDIVEQAVHSAGLQPSDLRLEITETAVMDAPHLAAPLLSDLRDFGVKIYLDDFGTGYSSLSHLHKLPVDALKIDRSFVRSLALEDRPAIVESILALARTLNTGVVAEGVETEAQARELERLGCRLAQGFYYSPPLPVAAVDDLLAAGRPLGERRTAMHAVLPRSRQTA